MKLGEADVPRDFGEPRLPLVLALDEFDGACHAREFTAVDEALD